MAGRKLFLVVMGIIVVVIAFVLYYQQIPSKELSTTSEERVVMGLSINSSVFKHGEKIPRKYTCDGEDVSPPLSWSGAPKGTKSFGLIMDDPDAPSGVFTHWVLFNLPADAQALPEALPKEKTLENGGVQGRNDFGKIGYGGPCPPPGKPHRYRFHLYALDTDLKLGAGGSKRDVLKAIEGHILGEGEITGVYWR